MSDARTDFFASGAKGSKAPPSRDDFFAGTYKPEDVPDARPSKGAPIHGKGYLDAEAIRKGGFNPVTGVGETALQAGTGLASSTVGGIAGIANAVWNISPAGLIAHHLGLPEADSADVVRGIQEAGTYQPRTTSGQEVAGAVASPANPMNWPGVAGEFLGDAAADAGAPASLSTALRIAPEAAAMVFGARRARAVSPHESPTAPIGAAARAPDEVPKRAERVVTLDESPDATIRQQEAPPKPLTAEGAPRGAAYTDLEGAVRKGEAPKFAEETPVAHKGTQLPPEQQAMRARILEEIGIGDDVRQSAVTGDAKAASTDFQNSKLDNAGGDHLRQVFEKERAALTSHADRLVNDTGGTVGLGQTETLQRGQNIVAPLDDLKAHFDNGIRSLYRVADERAAGRPVQIAKTRELLADDSEFLGTVEGESLLKGVRARMKALGMLDAEGKPLAVTVKEAERFKQYLGDQWTPRTSKLIRRIKESIDDDVMSAAGEDIYSSARGLRAERARILDDPKGIAKIMDAEGPEGINRSVAIEKIPDTITTLPVAQFQHIVRTLNEAPAEIRPQARAALAEIKSQFANKVSEIANKHAGQWNAKGVSQYLNANSARMKAIFSPEELRGYATLNDAGHILRFDASYPGAAVQAHNLAKSGVMHAVEHSLTAGGAGVGGILGGGIGAAAGAGAGRVLGSKITKGMSDRASLKAAQSRTGKLSDLLKLKDRE